MDPLYPMLGIEHMADPADRRVAADQLSRACIDQQWDIETLESECLKYSFPVELDYGKCHLFTQEHIHGNINNDTTITRSAWTFAS